MNKRRKTLPSHQIQAEKNRLSEKREALERKGHSNYRSGFFHKRRPEQAELKREHRSRHRADGEKNGCTARPSFCQLQENRATGAKIKRFGDHHQNGQANSNGSKHDVERQGHAHLPAGKKEIAHWEVRTRLNVAVRVTRDQRHFADATKSLLGL